MIFNLAKQAGADFVAGTNGGEYAGECPKCGGNDRFRVWPEQGDCGRFWCRQCEWSGDGITYLREVKNLSFEEAARRVQCEWKIGEAEEPESGYPSPESETDTVQPPPEKWQERARHLIEAGYKELVFSDSRSSESAIRYMRNRGIEKRTLKEHFLGVVPESLYETPDTWGLGRDRKVWVPRGILFPWVVGRKIWGLNVRRPDGDVEDGRKYQRVPGTTNSLYVTRNRGEGAMVMVEGEIDALAVAQEHPGVSVVATGSTHWGRTRRWTCFVRKNSDALILSFDDEEAGDKAAGYWKNKIEWSVRHAPTETDPAEMLAKGRDLRGWVEGGIRKASENLKSFRI